MSRQKTSRSIEEKLDIRENNIKSHIKETQYLSDFSIHEINSGYKGCIENYSRHRIQMHVFN